MLILLHQKPIDALNNQYDNNEMITTKSIDKLDHFDGGIKLAEHKRQSNQSAIATMPQSKHYIIPLQQHIGAPSFSAGEKRCKSIKRPDAGKTQ